MQKNIELEEKISEAVEYIKKQNSVIIAFSGGVDSSLLLALAKKSGVKYLAVTFHSYLYNDDELELIKSFVKSNNINHKIILTDPLNDIYELKNNPKNRCYFCKKYLYNELIKLKENIKFNNILDGSNYDDEFSFRPGKKAVKELDILSPLALFKFTKTDIREAAKIFNLAVYNKPSLSCYLTRYEYDKNIDISMIKKIEESETFLHNLGLTTARCRVHSDVFLRLEFNEEQMIQTIIHDRKVIIDKMKSLGFKYITIDLEGYITGSMDR